jgi:F-box protein 28
VNGFLKFCLLFVQVCKKFNENNMKILNHGFYTLLTYHSKQLKRIKSQLPRRESERRNHPCKFQLKKNRIDLLILRFASTVSKHSDVLTCIETRLSMLSMTYQKYIQNGSVCFIPGKVRIPRKIHPLMNITQFSARR